MQHLELVPFPCKEEFKLGNVEIKNYKKIESSVASYHHRGRMYYWSSYVPEIGIKYLMMIQ